MWIYRFLNWLSPHCALIVELLRFLECHSVGFFKAHFDAGIFELHFGTILTHSLGEVSYVPHL